MWSLVKVVVRTYVYVKHSLCDNLYASVLIAGDLS